MDQWSADYANGGDRRSAGYESGDAGREYGNCRGGGGTGAGGPGELSLLRERMGEECWRIASDADSVDNGGGIGRDVPVVDELAEDFDSGEFSAKHDQRDVRGATGGGRDSGSVRDAGGGAAGSVGLQNDGDERRSICERPVRLGQPDGEGAEHGRVRRDDPDCERGELGAWRRSTSLKSKQRRRRRCSYSIACLRRGRRSDGARMR